MSIFCFWITIGLRINDKVETRDTIFIDEGVVHMKRKLVWILVFFVSLLVGGNVQKIFADELSTTITVDVVQTLSGDAIPDAFTAQYQLKPGNPLAQSKAAAEIPDDFASFTLDKTNNKKTLSFGRQGVLLKSEGDYTFTLSTLQANMPTYKIDIKVNGNLGISEVVVLKDDASHKKSDSFTFHYVFNKETEPTSTSTSSSESLSTTSSSTTSSSTTTSSSAPGGGSGLPRTGNPIADTTNKVLKAMHLPQTGTQEATFIGLFGILLVLGGGGRIFFILWKRRQNNQAE